jgi:hypothetical protein
VNVQEKISAEGGFTILHKWKSEHTQLRGSCSLVGFGVDFDCRIYEIAGTLLTLHIINSPIRPWFDLKSCLFTYGDPPPSLAAHLLMSGRGDVSALFVKSFTGGWSCALVEL